jgi:hypothetical protein
MTIKKFTTREVMEWAWEEGRDMDFIGDTYRWCTCCGAYVEVDDYATEAERDNKTYYDSCYDCIEREEAGQEIEEFEDDIPDTDETCDYCGGLLVTEEELESECCRHCA